MTLIIFLLLLSVLVIVHELGHFLAARLFKVKAEEFGVGFPPRIVGFVKEKSRWKKVNSKDETSYKNTIWSFNWLPLGGFVRIKGEQENGINDHDSIHSKPIWQRVIIISAGVIMNWLAAILLFTGLYFFGINALYDTVPGPTANISDSTVVVTETLPDSPAAKAGLEIGDEIISINGTTYVMSDQVREAIQGFGENTFDLSIRREGEEKDLKVTPEFISEINRYGLGVGLANSGRISFPLHLAFVNAVKTTYDLTKTIVFAFGGIIRDLFVDHRVAEDVSGPVGIAVIAGKIAKQGIAPFVQFAAVISVNLAVINFLPIPSLDGGRVVFLIYEKLRRRPVNRKLELSMNKIAFLILILLVILVTARDVSRYGSIIMGGVKGLVGL
ncbi:MAG: RIP metalloprotease RseP [Patescibacteria group bacterium]